mgnify:CR=1 FL=1
MKNILIGFLMATCIFLMMGAKSESNVMSKIQTAFSENGRYQISGDGASRIYMVDTRTGKMYESKYGKVDDLNQYHWCNPNNEDDMILYSIKGE